MGACDNRLCISDECPSGRDPVCATNGREFNNACWFENANVSSAILL